MWRKGIRTGIAVVFLLMLFGCGTMKTSELVPDVIYAKKSKDKQCRPTDVQALFLAPGAPALKAMLASSSLSREELIKASPEASALSKAFTLSAVSARLDAVKAELPEPLAKDRVLLELLRSVGFAVSTAQNAIVMQAGLSPDLVSVTDTVNFDSPANLDEVDFKNFAEKIRQSMATAPFAYGAQVAGDDRHLSATDDGEAIKFGTAFVNYFSAYYKGNYVDRFGTALPKPAITRTIGNTEIAGTLQVLVELILDYSLKTPVWQDAAKTYYPGSFAKDTAPTVVVAKLVKPTPLLSDDADTHSCGITKLKAEAIEYIANAAADKASAMGGLVGGSFGGLQFGLGIFGKFSVGDNQTLSVLVKTTLAKVFERAGEEASYRVLYWIPYNDKAVLADLVQQYLDSQSNKGKPSTKQP